jgi:hypothetical protein
VPKATADFYGMIQTDPGNLAELKLRRIIRYLRQIERWRKEERQEPPSRRRKVDKLCRMDFTKNKAWQIEMAILKFLGGYYWGYTK